MAITQDEADELITLRKSNADLQTANTALAKTSTDLQSSLDKLQFQFDTTTIENASMKVTTDQMRSYVSYLYSNAPTGVDSFEVWVKKSQDNGECHI